MVITGKIDKLAKTHYNTPMSTRMHINPIPPELLQRRLSQLTPTDQIIIRDAAQTLRAKIRNVGEVTALSILWAIGQAMKRQEDVR